MKLEREKWMRMAALAAALVIVFLSLILWFLMRGRDRLEVGFSLPRVSPTPEITVSPTPAEVKVTPAPTPLVVQVDRHYPPEAVDLVSNGRVLFTLESEAAAREALDRYLNEYAREGLRPNERLIRAGFDQHITLEEPSGKGELYTLDEAVNTLKADEGLLPMVRTVVRCEIERGTVETVAKENVALPQGSRIYRDYGVYPYILSYYETVYRGQAAFSEVKTNEFEVGPGKADRIVEDGGWAMEEGSPQAGAPVVALEGFSPGWPVEGTVTGSYGLSEEGLRYGVEIAADMASRVRSPEEGVVVYCARRGELGLVIDILHDETGAMSRIIGCEGPLVELYQRVKKGEQVAAMPQPVNDRRATIRYELLINGLPVNPEKYLPKR